MILTTKHFLENFQWVIAKISSVPCKPHWVHYLSLELRDHDFVDVLDALLGRAVVRHLARLHVLLRQQVVERADVLGHLKDRQATFTSVWIMLSKDASVPEISAKGIHEFSKYDFTSDTEDEV